LLVFFFMLPYKTSADGQIRFDFMNTLVHQIRITPMRYSMVGPLFSIPLWLISLVIDNSSIVLRYNLFLFAFFLITLYQWLKNQFDRTFLIIFMLVLVFGSMFPGHLLNYYGEVFSAVCLGLGIVGIATKRAWAGWILSILAVLNTPAFLSPFILIVLYHTWESRQIRYLALIPVCVVLLVGESYLRTGGILAGFRSYLQQDHGFQTILPYSGRTGYSYPFGLGILSILLSFGKGLVFYCPGLLFAGWIWKSIPNPVERKILTLWMLTVLGLILAYASWWSWYGGWFWGPRFFLFASIPAAWILAKLIVERQITLGRSLVLLGLVGLSVWVGVNGIVFQQKTLDVCMNNSYALESLCWYVPEFSPLVRPFITRATITLNDWLFLWIFVCAWLYLSIPLAVNLVRQIIRIFQANRSLFKLSIWKI